MRWIGQCQVNDCSIAAAAMALDLSYEEAASVLHKPVCHDPGTPEHEAETDAFMDGLRSLAAAKGLAIRDQVSLIPEAGRRYIAGVATPGNAAPHHCVAIDKDGNAFDPDDPNPRRWYDYRIFGLLEVYRP